jgi:uncharacterized protein (AIM24 family)
VRAPSRVSSDFSAAYRAESALFIPEKAKSTRTPKRVLHVSCFALPGHIVPVEISPEHEYMIHRHGFLCATPQVQIGVGFQQSLGAGIFGGDGFLLQRVSGQGTAWLDLSGELVVRDLQPGETLRVHPGHVGAFQASVSFQITTVPGIKNMIFGGDGIFRAALTGPGRIWLQTLPIARLAHALERYMPHEPRRETVEGGVVGGIVGSILDNMK